MGPLRTLGRSMRRSGLRLCLMGVAALAVMAPGTAASADPSVAEIEKQLDTQWNALEPVIENYNAVHESLKKNQAKADELEKTLKPLELQVDLAQSRVSGIASQAYKSGSASSLSAILNSTSPDSLLDQLTILNQISRQQTRSISAVKETRDKYLGDKRELDKLVTDLASQDADLAAKKKDIEAQIANLQKLRQRAYGTTGATGNLRPAGVCPVEYIGGAAGNAVNRACSKIGSKYVYGSAGPSTFDCSGLTMWAWSGGKSLPHNAASQKSQTTSVSRDNLRSGDLIFYGSPPHHVAIYVGGGYMVHAPRTGDVVREASINGPGTPSGYGRVA